MPRCGTNTMRQWPLLRPSIEWVCSCSSPGERPARTVPTHLHGLARLWLSYFLSTVDCHITVTEFLLSRLDGICWTCQKGAEFATAVFVVCGSTPAGPGSQQDSNDATSKIESPLSHHRLKPPPGICLDWEAGETPLTRGKSCNFVDETERMSSVKS